MQIQRLEPSEFDHVIDDLVTLLQGSVRGGASIGFLLPITEEAAIEYWREVETALQGSFRIMLLARTDEKVVGSVQLDLASRPNGSHRAEVIKLMVHCYWQNRGIGQALLKAIEQEARAARRTTLVLDTREGDPSEGLYLKMGYVRAGTIPEYARSIDGSLHTTVFMYKLLASK